MATFITSKAVGESITIAQQTSTGYWKYNHNGSDSSVFASGLGISSQPITVANANGEFTIISCLADGTPSGNIIYLGLNDNQLTSFDGTDLTSLTDLYLQNNLLTSFDGTGLTSLNTLWLYSNQLTSFDGTGLTSLTYLDLNNNQLTSFDGTGLTSLINLVLVNNLLTSIDVSPMVNLISLFLTDVYGLNGNPMTATANNNVLAALVANGVTRGNFSTANGRTSAGTSDYNTLIANGWNLVGLELGEETTTTTTAAPSNPTFITAQSVGNDITINVQTSTGYWKYNHNGTDSSVFSDGSQTITVANANGEFTLIPCLADGTPSGNITFLNSNGNQLTSFDGTGLSSLTDLYLNNNQLTSFDGTGLTSLIELLLYTNQLTSFDGTDLTSLPNLNLDNNQLTSFDGTGLTSLTNLSLGNNQLTSLEGFIFPSSLTTLGLENNQLTSIDVSPLTNLTSLFVNNNFLVPSVNNLILSQLVANGKNNGIAITSGGRTSAGTNDFMTLQSRGWNLQGFNDNTTTTTTTSPITTTTTTAAPSNPTFITSKAVGNDININVETSTTYWKYNHNGTDSSVFSNGSQTITVANANGEFTLIPCLSDGTVSGDITALQLSGNQLTSFDGTGLSSLTQLYLGNNQLTSFDGTGLTSLTDLLLQGNQLTSFDGTGLTSLTGLSLDNNQLTSFDGTGLTSLTNLYLQNNQITLFDGTDLTSLTTLGLVNNLLTSIDVSPMVALTDLYLADVYGLNGNPMTASSNDTILADIVAQNRGSMEKAYIATSGGRTSAGTADYNTLIAEGWNLVGLELGEETTTTTTTVAPSGKLRIKGVTQINP
jgi:Leucine-rich repeat (LRR) protein